MNRKARAGAKSRAIVAQSEESRLRKKLTWNDVKKLGLGRVSPRLEVLDTGGPTGSGDTFVASPNRDGRINFASTVSSGVKSLSRLARFSTAQPFASAATETQRPEARLFLQREVSLSCLHGEYARLLSLGRNSRERNLSAGRKNFRHLIRQSYPNAKVTMSQRYLRANIHDLFLN